MVWLYAKRELELLLNVNLNRDASDNAFKNFLLKAVTQTNWCALFLPVSICMQEFFEYNQFNIGPLLKSDPIKAISIDELRTYY